MGEEKAIEFLKNIGYDIVERNYYTNNGEIDIVAIDKNEYVFIEVKTRLTKKYGEPIDAVNKNKKKHIISATKYFLYKNGLENRLIRFDIIEVYLNRRSSLINHIKNVFF